GVRGRGPVRRDGDGLRTGGVVLVEEGCRVRRQVRRAVAHRHGRDRGRARGVAVEGAAGATVAEGDGGVAPGDPTRVVAVSVLERDDRAHLTGGDGLRRGRERRRGARALRDVGAHDGAAAAGDAGGGDAGGRRVGHGAGEVDPAVAGLAAGGRVRVAGETTDDGRGRGARVVGAQQRGRSGEDGGGGRRPGHR